MKYQVISTSAIGDLILQVEELLKAGWRCQGGLIVTSTGWKDHNGTERYIQEYFQAMVRGDVYSFQGKDWEVEEKHWPPGKGL